MEVKNCLQKKIQMKNNDNFILLSGRPCSGKTEMLIAYANMYPSTTLILSEENTRESLIDKKLSEKVIVTDSQGFKNIDMSKYNTVCIDYLELMDYSLIDKIIKEIVRLNIRLIILTQLDRNYNLRVNPFIKYFKGEK